MIAVMLAGTVAIVCTYIAIKSLIWCYKDYNLQEKEEKENLKKCIEEFENDNTRINRNRKKNSERRNKTGKKEKKRMGEFYRKNCKEDGKKQQQLMGSSREMRKIN